MLLKNNAINFTLEKKLFHTYDRCFPLLEKKLTVYNLPVDSEKRKDALKKIFSDFIKNYSLRNLFSREYNEKVKKYTLFSYTQFKKYDFLKKSVIAMQNPYYRFYIKVTSNNIFATLQKINTLKNFNLILFTKSAKMQINSKITKRKINFLSKLYIESLISEIEKHLIPNSLFFINIIAPVKSRVIFLETLLKMSSEIYFFILLNKKYKCFNGCKARKLIKKKRKYNALFKY